MVNISVVLTEDDSQIDCQCCHAVRITALSTTSSRGTRGQWSVSRHEGDVVERRIIVTELKQEQLDNLMERRMIQMQREMDAF